MTKTYALDSLETEIITLLQHLHVGASITLTKKLTESGDVAVELSRSDRATASQGFMATYWSWRKEAEAEGFFDDPDYATVWDNVREEMGNTFIIRNPFE